MRQRGKDALLEFHVDFVTLPLDGRRIFLEVDGDTHYTTDQRPDRKVYAGTVQSDRRLRINGYDTYRFGASELVGDQSASATAAVFSPDRVKTRTHQNN